MDASSHGKSFNLFYFISFLAAAAAAMDGGSSDSKDHFGGVKLTAIPGRSGEDGNGGRGAVLLKSGAQRYVK